jgi:hypothetical protein
VMAGKKYELNPTPNRNRADVHNPCTCSNNNEMSITITYEYIKNGMRVKHKYT